jgi:predicted AlkP superfamily phosphohydrolase/phosphomutase
VLGRLFGKRGRNKVFVIGLDCAEPSLVFDRYADDLPNLSRLAAQGRHGTLETTIPAITVPAWSAMFSGRDPGELGFYGFRNRSDHSYDRMSIATGAAVQEPRVWDIAGKAGKRVAVVGVPQTFPVQPVNGWLVSGFLTPSTRSRYTWPEELADEIRETVGDYAVDVQQFRTDRKDYLLSQIQDMTERRCALVKHLLASKPWDLFVWVEIGVDRIHHGFWKYCDPSHPMYEPGNPYEQTMHDYYVYLDGQIGEMLDLLPRGTNVVVLSDHGGQPMMGGFCINEWLIQQGYLVLKAQPDTIARIEDCAVDWEHTRAWASGGYYARVFLNVEGREPQGVVPAKDYARVRDELAAALEAATDHEGKPMGTRAFRPEKVYRQVRNIPPDLIVYLGNLAWRSVGSIGHGTVHVFENDTGPDDANHAQLGMYIATGGEAPSGRAARTWRAVAPSILSGLGMTPPEWMGTERL